jgi:short-subunit dehydrogenase
MSKLETVLITGASEGIGRSFAKAFAQKGHTLIVVARNQEKLEQLADELKSNYATDCHVIAKDLSAENAAGELLSQVTDAGLHVDVLVNNAGMMQVEKLAEANEQVLNTLIQLNVSSVVHMTRQFIGPMLKKGAGKIVNVGSIASFMPTPNFSAYGASKAFVLSFTEGLSEELKGSGVTATCVCPGMTETKMLSHADGLEKYIPSFLKADPDTLAQQAYKATMNGEVIFLDKIANKMLVQWATHYPRWMVRGINGLFSKFN